VHVDWEAVLASEGLAVIEDVQPLPFSHPKIHDDAVFMTGQTRRDFVGEYRERKVAETIRLVAILEDILWGHNDDAQPLSAREHRVLRLYLVEGLTTWQIARRLRRRMRGAGRDGVRAILRGICERHGLPPLRFERSE
jgi:hypothetical protein